MHTGVDTLHDFCVSIFFCAHLIDRISKVFIFFTFSNLFTHLVQCGNDITFSDGLTIYWAIFTPQPLRAVGVLVSPMVSGWAVGLAMGKSLSGLYRKKRKV